MISQRAKLIKPSITLNIVSYYKKLKSENKDVVNLAAGELDFDTPDDVKEFAIRAIKEGFTKYTSSRGILELREAVCRKLKEDNDVSYEPSQIVISNGAKHSLSNTLFSLLDPQDEVIIFSPYWVSYPEMVKLAGASPRIVKFKPEENFRPNFDEIEKAISPRTKCIILNSPTNPTGLVWKKEELKQLLQICEQNNLFLISDEIYESLIYEGNHICFASLSKYAYEHTITIGGVSKSHAMTGWRIGWLAGPKEIAEAAARIQSQQTSNPCSISQRAALKALNNRDWIKEKKEELRKRRDYLLEQLREIGLKFIFPQAGFYIFCDISPFSINSLEFSQRLLKEKLVAVIPGSAFGEDNFIRISFTSQISKLEEGMRRLKQFLSSL